MNTLGSFFRKELNGQTFPEELLSGGILNFSVSRQDRSVKIHVDFPSFVEYSESSVWKKRWRVLHLV